MASLLTRYLVFLLNLVWLLCARAVWGTLSADAQGRTAFVSQPLEGNSTTLAAALQDPAVTNIVLFTNYNVDTDGDLQQPSGPLGPHIHVNR